eukprot:34150-Pelagomonas_calceolata.AAC.2
MEYRVAEPAPPRDEGPVFMHTQCKCLTLLMHAWCEVPDAGWGMVQDPRKVQICMDDVDACMVRDA